MPRASYSGEIARAGSRRLCSTFGNISSSCARFSCLFHIPGPALTCSSSSVSEMEPSPFTSNLSTSIQNSSSVMGALQLYSNDLNSSISICSQKKHDYNVNM